MRLRRPCKEHSLYDEHTYWNNHHAMLVTCPGGEFLPEDALRYWVTRTDGEPMGEFGGYMVESMDAARRMVREELEIEQDNLEDDDELITYTVEISAVVESVTLAVDQVDALHRLEDS